MNGASTGLLASQATTKMRINVKRIGIIHQALFSRRKRMNSAKSPSDDSFADSSNDFSSLSVGAFMLMSNK